MSDQPRQAAAAGHGDKHDDTMLVVLETGELRPGFYRGRKPA